MKTSLLSMKNGLATAMLLLSVIASAQQWQVTGNGGITPANYAGTVDPMPFYLRTNGASSNPGQAILNEAGSFIVDAVNNSNIAKVKGSIVTGSSNILGGLASSSIVSGWGNDLSNAGGANIVSGQDNMVLNNSSKSVALGWKNTIRNHNQFALGVGIDLKDVYSGGFGIDLAATGNRSFVIGSGTGGAKLTNNIPLSIMFGLSPTSTMLIKDKSVGILTLAPTANFHTVGTVRHENLPTGSGRALVVDASGNVMVSNTPLNKTASTSDETIQQLEDRIKNLENTVEEMKQLLLNKGVSSTDISSSDVAQLAQNVPNPTKNGTSISYYLPKSAKTASIEVYNISGQLVKSLPLHEKGNGTINLSGSELQSGTYVYSMITDGKVTGSKKMVIRD
ncbi:T9SS type A sorting domain-containing protein [Chryseobacterium sp. RP-3-3]|uniref:T9SS type A sorting domain-containing protein n=1 Tax=Chryseobacterium antibioticum TaxID=2728847 RepID=A0A7Y0AKY3_9FLAO|nr:T9SS type A sorting domain-containing protein [Chryseobacterium antibioticum]NML69264.1 T9SS type A sorting domain-containing protein [Chryseobacterium antibioticum]